MSELNPGIEQVGVAARQMRISVCVCTYRRNAQLALLLGDLSQQTLPPVEVVVVDNDADGPARSLVEAFQAPFVLRYAVQPVKNISLTRNVTIAMSSGDWIAIIDDDERAPADWLSGMAATLKGADGVLGHVDCIVPPEAPAWIRDGHFYDSPVNRHGETFALNRISKGNALLRGSLVRAEPGPYDPALGLTGGEDADLYARLAKAGAKLVWCDHPRLSEPVDPGRLTLRWLLTRAYRGGQDYSRNRRRGDFGGVGVGQTVVFFLECLFKLLVALAGTLLSSPMGRHRSMSWLVKAAANWGKLTSFWGWHHGEYAATANTKLAAPR